MASSGSVAAFRCACGAIRGRIEPEPRAAGTHIVCFCKDCRAGHIWCGAPDPALDGVHILQTTPDAIRIETGQDRLGLFRLHPKGLLRWRAACCGVPMFNTLARPQLAFAGLFVERLETSEAAGPVRARAFVPGPPGTPARHQGGLRLTLGVLTRMAAARMSGRWRQTPFFDIATGAPVTEAYVLTRQERAGITR